MSHSAPLQIARAGGSQSLGRAARHSSTGHRARRRRSRRSGCRTLRLVRVRRVVGSAQLLQLPIRRPGRSGGGTNRRAVGSCAYRDGRTKAASSFGRSARRKPLFRAGQLSRKTQGEPPCGVGLEYLNWSVKPAEPAAVAPASQHGDMCFVTLEAPVRRHDPSSEAACRCHADLCWSWRRPWNSGRSSPARPARRGRASGPIAAKLVCQTFFVDLIAGTGWRRYGLRRLGQGRNPDQDPRGLVVSTGGAPSAIACNGSPFTRNEAYSQARENNGSAG